jgi:hypothetical protein
MSEDSKHFGLIARMHAMLGFDQNKSPDEKAADIDKFLSGWQVLLPKNSEQPKTDTKEQEVYDEKYTQHVSKPKPVEDDEPF